MSSDLPELEFNLDEAFLRMDEAIGETIARLPDFPGFYERRTLQLKCAEEGRESYEISYTLPEATIGSELVTMDYFEVLKEHWPAIGYEIHAERKYPDGNPKALEATRSDGVNVWYSNMLGQIVIHAQVACVRAEGSPVCGPPLGGVLPENDNHKHCQLVTPEETESADAIAPFKDGQAMLRPFEQPGREPEGFDGQL
ncbi:hypothetical protein [Glycomyces sp. NPDC021274]|uniref:hypothetical protein n=1 Tax=Glycomyces sp. NPDC021274 TaxID=3155120 RepID=UPI00340F6F65